MAAVKLTKNELKRQKDQLRQFERYLPTLQLKKQQLQLVIRQIELEELEYRSQQRALISALQPWIAVFHENQALEESLRLEHLVVVTKVERDRGNIAGVTIPVFRDLQFQDIVYDLYRAPLWIDYGIDVLRRSARFDAIITTLHMQIELLGRELRITSQRVNLFEKVKIPETRENIRRISIYLGDQQTAAVVRGKIAKKKLIQAYQEGSA